MAKIEMKMGKSPKSKKHRGTINIDSADVPDAKNWKIGDKVKLTVEVEVTGLRKPDRWEIEEEGMSKDIIKVQSEITTITTANASK